MWKKHLHFSGSVSSSFSLDNEGYILGSRFINTNGSVNTHGDRMVQSLGLQALELDLSGVKILFLFFFFPNWLKVQSSFGLLESYVSYF